MRQDAGTMGCLLIGKSERLDALRRRVEARGMVAASVAPQSGLLEAAQAELYAVRTPRGACVAAEGEWWSAALALAEQLSVERVALIAPTDGAADGVPDALSRANARLKDYARRNLFFCVSAVLALEAQADERSARRVDRMLHRLCNARVCRASLVDARWLNCKQSPLDAAARFLADGTPPFALAKSPEKCIIEA